VTTNSFIASPVPTPITSRNTLKQHFRALVEGGRLNQHGSGRGVWYELR